MSATRLAAVLALLATAAACGSSLRQEAEDVVAPQHFADRKEPPSPLEATRRDRVLAVMPKVKGLLDATAGAFPSLAVGVVVGDDLVWSAGWGSREDQTKDPVTADTVFRIGSLTRVFTATALLQLRDAGKLSFDVPVTRYLPELEALVYPTRDSPFITLRHLVTHCAGLTSEGTLDLTSEHEVSESELVKAALTDTVWFAPGSRTSPSNLGLALAGLVVARQSRQPYTEYVGRRLLAPLGMTASVWDRARVPNGRLAQGHVQGPSGLRPGGAHLKLGAAAGMGGLYSSVSDLARFVAFELTAWPARDAPDPGPVRRATVRESQLAFGPVRSGPVYGADWLVFEDADLGYTVFHDGTAGDYSAAVWMLPRRQVAVVALAGSGDYGSLAKVTKQVLATVASASPDPPPTLGPPAAAALARVLALLGAPDAERIKGAFSPQFLTSITPDQLTATIAKVTKATGACRDHRPIRVDSATEATVRLTCEHGAIDLDLITESRPPYLITGLLVSPVQSR
jgi:CubicO group peptidase (beta-lactamase class C family)